MIGSARAFAPVTLILSIVLSLTAPSTSLASRAVKSTDEESALVAFAAGPSTLMSTFMSSRPTLHFRKMLCSTEFVDC